MAKGKTITGDALLTQRKLAEYIVEERNAHYLFTAKGNQNGVPQDIHLYFEDRKEPDFIDCAPPGHVHIEIRKIWTTAELNSSLDFPHVGQAFAIERHVIHKKRAKHLVKWPGA
jgi:hypothetical protein